MTRLYDETETPVLEISERFGIGESSVYRVAQRHGAGLRRDAGKDNSLGALRPHFRTRGDEELAELFDPAAKRSSDDEALFQILKFALGQSSQI